MAGIPVVIQKSPFNSVPFVTENAGVSARYLTQHPGTTWEVNTYAKGVIKRPYYAKVTFEQIIDLEFSITYANVGPVLKVELLRVLQRPSGTVFDAFYSWVPVNAAYVPNNTAEVNGVIMPMITAHFRFSLSEVPNLPEGEYFLRFTIQYASDGTTPFNRTLSDISEPISVRKSHPGTLHLTCTNRTNDYNTIFVNYLFPTFGVRVEGSLSKYIPDLVDSDFTTQSGRITKLSAVPGFTKRLIIGGGLGISEWVKAWVDHWISADNKYVDGREISKDSGASWEEISASNQYPLGGLMLPVRYADKYAQYQTLALPYLVLTTRPATGFPYAIYPAAMHRTGFSVQSLGGPYIITSPSSEAAAVSRMQTKAVMIGLNGTVLLSNGEIRYEPALGEIFDVSDSVVLPIALNLAINTTYGANYGFTVTGNRLAVDWGDGSANGYGTGSASSLSPSHAYTAGSVFNATVFHANNYTDVNFGGAAARVVAISGKTATTTTSFAIANNFLTSFDLQVVQPAYANLATLNIRANTIASLTNLSVLSAPGANFAALLTVDAKVNKFPVPTVDAVISAVNAANNLNNGLLAVQLQDPLAPPSNTGPGSAYNNLVNNRNWTVTTD